MYGPFMNFPQYTRETVLEGRFVLLLPGLCKACTRQAGKLKLQVAHKLQACRPAPSCCAPANLCIHKTISTASENGLLRYSTSGSRTV